MQINKKDTPEPTMTLFVRCFAFGGVHLFAGPYPSNVAPARPPRNSTMGGI